MSRLLARLILAFTFILAIPVVYVTVLIVIAETCQWGEEEAFLATSAVTASLAVVGWVSVWWPQVPWTTWRWCLTALAVVWSALVGFVVGMVVDVLTHSDEMGMVLGGLFWVLCWLASTAFIWRETAAERADRLQGGGRAVIHCPRCGYNLTGLREARCPECGTQYTLDELLALAKEPDAELDSVEKTG